MVHAVAPKDEEIIRNPDNWPLFPLLPMKRSRRGGWPEHGVLICATLVGDMPEPINLRRGALYDSMPLSDREVIKYNTIGDMLNDGWRVD